MRILAIDVGLGTQDVLLYDEAKNPENCVKMVFPAMTQVLAKKVRESNSNLLFHGETMGGGALAFAISKHIERGYRVLMTPSAATSIRDNLEQVRETGVEIIDEEEIESHGDYEKIETKDIDFEALKCIFHSIGESFWFDCISIAVQDHGHATQKSDREFRFEKFREKLEKGAFLNELGYESPPSYYTRMNAALRTAKRYYSGRVFIADTKIAAIAGALHGVKERPAIAIDVGNGHTMVALVDSGDKVLGLLEHHTHMLSKKKLETLIVKFANGLLANDDVFKDRGHGCCILKKVGIRKVKRILATGPNRGMLQNSRLRVEFANPIGDVMMTGPIGLVDTVLATWT